MAQNGSKRAKTTPIKTIILLAALERELFFYTPAKMSPKGFLQLKSHLSPDLSRFVCS